MTGRDLWFFGAGALSVIVLIIALIVLNEMRVGRLERRGMRVED